jgi:hypothetical protein
MQVQPFEIHFVWGGKGKEGKRQRMREVRVYHDPPAYYSEGGFMSVGLDYLQVRGLEGGGDGGFGGRGAAGEAVEVVEVGR